MEQTITPCLWFDHCAREAVDFYVSVFPTSAELSVSHYPTEGLLDFQRDLAGEPLEIRFRLADLEFSALNAGPEFPLTPALSMMLTFDPSRDEDAAGHLDRMWEALLADGEVLMDLAEYPFSPRYGWLRDRFGMTWQLILTDPAGDPRPFITPSLLFPHGRSLAGRAIATWTSLFADSSTGISAPYPPDAGQAPGALSYADLTLEGQWFAVMDSGVPQDFTFTEGVSLVVACEDQEEIDRLWEGLSAVPEAEACGWCKDRFGVSWQVVPRDLDTLMERPGAWQTLLAAKKIVIADFA